MKKLILLSFFSLVCLTNISADNWCTLCLKGQNVKLSKKETPKIKEEPKKEKPKTQEAVAEVPNKPEHNCKVSELFGLLKNASFETTLGTRTIKEPVTVTFTENGENISCALVANDEVNITSNKTKEDILPTWNVNVINDNNKSLNNVSIDDIINIIKASEEK